MRLGMNGKEFGLKLFNLLKAILYYLYDCSIFSKTGLNLQCSLHTLIN